MDKYKVSHVIMKHNFGKAGFNGTMYELRCTIDDFIIQIGYLA